MAIQHQRTGSRCLAIDHTLEGTTLSKSISHQSQSQCLGVDQPVDDDPDPRWMALIDSLTNFTAVAKS
ncbi:MAG: hypothetical protein SCH68_09955 [Brevefilum sp.]|nr:hypothetical protein [Brevefilum sp.]